MARLHDSRRPLVVSFRRKKATLHPQRKQVTIFDGHLQEALSELSVAKRAEEADVLQLVEVHSLQPTHICPLNAAILGGSVEAFGQKMALEKKKTKSRSGSVSSERKGEKKVMAKSCTMPELKENNGDEEKRVVLYEQTKIAVSVN